jgi:hypothetical protein
MNPLRYISLCLAIILTLFTIGSFAKEVNHEVTPEQYVTEEELAAIYVLSEICPNLITNQQDFSNGYQTLLEEYLPNIKNPVDVLQSLSQEQKFAPILAEAKQDALNAGDAKNTQICQELTTYRK